MFVVFEQWLIHLSRATITRPQNNSLLKKIVPLSSHRSCHYPSFELSILFQNLLCLNIYVYLKKFNFFKKTDQLPTTLINSKSCTVISGSSGALFVTVVVVVEVLATVDVDDEEVESGAVDDDDEEVAAVVVLRTVSSSGGSVAWIRSFNRKLIKKINFYQSTPITQRMELTISREEENTYAGEAVERIVVAKRRLCRLLCSRLLNSMYVEQTLTDQHRVIARTYWHVGEYPIDQLRR